jgi:hypothetical protein
MIHNDLPTPCCLLLLRKGKQLQAFQEQGMMQELTHESPEKKKSSQKVCIWVSLLEWSGFVHGISGAAARVPG